MSDRKSPRGPASIPAADLPPPYSPNCGSAGPRDSNGVPGLPDVPYDQYSPASASFSSDELMLTVADGELASNPTALAAFLRAQAALPPLLTMRVKGASVSYNSPDFDVSLNLMRYILEPQSASTSAAENSSSRSLGGHVQLDVKRLPAEAQGRFKKRELTVQSLAQSFCSDRLTTKSLTLTRRVTNLDESILTARVMQMLGELKYMGNVEVSFPVRASQVRITPSTTALDKFVGFFSKPRDYAAMEVRWPYAAAPPAGPEQYDAGHAPDRGFAVRSEEGVWYDWRPAFERAILSGRKGWVTAEDLMEAKMGLPGPKQRVTEWGTSSSSASGATGGRR